MKLRALTDRLTEWSDRLTWEYQHLDQQPYRKFVVGNNWFLFGSLFYMVQMLLVGIMAAYGGDQFATATGSLWLAGIFNLSVIIFKMAVILMAAMACYYLLVSAFFGSSFRERLKKRDESKGGEA